MEELPTTMRSFVAPKCCKPAEYEVIHLPLPSINKPDEMLIKVHAASIITGDTLVASGYFRFMFKSQYPFKLSIGCSGTVVSVGSAVTNFVSGDAVYGLAFGRPMDFTNPPGFCSEYCIGREPFFVSKPSHTTFEEATSLFGNALTAYESFELAEKHIAASGKTLQGSTVFVPAALSATGSLGIQFLKNVYGVKKVIATVSTAKIPLVEKYLPGLVDQVIDYQKTPKLTDVVEPGSVDFAYNTQLSTLESIVPLVKKDTGVIVSIASVAPSRILKLALGPALPFWVGWVADLVGLYYQWLISGTNIKFDFVSGSAADRKLVEKTAKVIELQKVKSVMRVVKLEDIDALRKACGEVYTGKGGLGGLVVKII